jgi:2'-5' RNA ligase
MTQPAERKLRLFVAFELPGAVLEALVQLQAQLQRQRASGLRWVRPEGIHLTLKFLGEVPQEQVPAIADALVAAVSSLPTVTLRLGSLGTFGDRRGPRVVWIGVNGETTRLLTVQAAVERSLTPLGFRPENRPFSPHLTLARVQDNIPESDRRRIAAIISAATVPPAPPMTLSEVSLIQSTLGPGGAVYTRLAVAPLGGSSV